jgi:hypothetical protein
VAAFAPHAFGDAFSTPGGSPTSVNAALSRTLGPASSSSVAVARVAASAALALGGMVSVAGGGVSAAAASQTMLGALSASASASNRVTGNASTGLTAAFAVSGAVARVTATSTRTLGALSAQSTGSLRVSAAATRSLGTLTGAAVASVAQGGGATLDVALAPLQAGSVGSVRIGGGAGLLLMPAYTSASFEATDGPPLSADLTLDGLALSADAETLATADLLASLAMTLDASFGYSLGADADIETDALGLVADGIVFDAPLSFADRHAARAFRVFSRARMDAYNATYIPPSGEPIPARVMVNQGAQIEFGGEVQAQVPGITLDIMRADVSEPMRGAVVAIGPARYVLDAPVFDACVIGGFCKWIVFRE